MPLATADRFGFRFWLGWILWFAGSFILAAGFWTILLQVLFARIEGPELTVTWAVSVFGSWFMILTPFMRKKEQIWKRLNVDQEKAVDAWLKGMGLFIGALIASTIFWSYQFRERILIESKTSFDPEWIKAVSVSWLLLALPFLVFMYRKADQIFKDAHARQTARGPSFKSTFVEKAKRLLPKEFSHKLDNVPPVLPDGHVVTLSLKNGSKIPDVYVFKAREILGIYNREKFDFEPADISDLKAQEADQLPSYEESRWLRLDGST